MKYIKEKLISKKAKFNQKINEEINNIFDSKKSYIFHLYYLSDIINNHEKSKITDNKDLSFVDKMTADAGNTLPVCLVFLGICKEYIQTVLINEFQHC